MANRPKGKLMALLAIFAAIGIVTATGAFTSVQAERTVTVQTAGDSAANLLIQSAGGNADNYVTSDGDTVELDFSGVNLRAVTDFGAVLNITNNLATGQTVYVQIATESSMLSDASSFGTLVGDSGQQPLVFEDSSGNSIVGGDADTGNSSLALDPGESADVHISIDVSGTTAGTLVDGQSIVIVADTTDPAL